MRLGCPQLSGRLTMHLADHDLRRIDEAYLDGLSPEALREVSKRLCHDLKEARERLNQTPENSSRPPSTRAPGSETPSETETEEQEQEKAAEGAKDLTSDGKAAKEMKKYGSVIGALAGGVLGGVLTVLAYDFILVKQKVSLESEVSIDSAEARQGTNSVRWDFSLQPEKKYVVSSPSTIGGFLHLEVRADEKGRIRGVDLQNYKELRFFAKSSKELGKIDEVNLFTGPYYIQYIYSSNGTFLLSTKWAEYRISLDKFTLARWEKQYRRHLIDDNNVEVPAMDNVTGIGFDLKTDDRARTGKIWIDYVRLVDEAGNEEVLSKGDDDRVEFSGRTLVWGAGAREYRE
jgi:hypothetical protein